MAGAQFWAAVRFVFVALGSQARPCRRETKRPTAVVPASIALSTRRPQSAGSTGGSSATIGSSRSQTSSVSRWLGVPTISSRRRCSSGTGSGVPSGVVSGRAQRLPALSGSTSQPGGAGGSRATAVSSSSQSPSLIGGQLGPRGSGAVAGAQYHQSARAYGSGPAGLTWSAPSRPTATRPSGATTGSPRRSAICSAGRRPLGRAAARPEAARTRTPAERSAAIRASSGSPARRTAAASGAAASRISASDTGSSRPSAEASAASCSAPGGAITQCGPTGRSVEGPPPVVATGTGGATIPAVASSRRRTFRQARTGTGADGLLGPPPPLSAPPPPTPPPMLIGRPPVPAPARPAGLSGPGRCGAG